MSELLCKHGFGAFQCPHCPAAKYRDLMESSDDDQTVVLAAQLTRVAELEGALTHILELIEYQDRPVAQIKVRARMALEGGKSDV